MKSCCCCCFEIKEAWKREKIINLKFSPCSALADNVKWRWFLKWKLCDDEGSGSKSHNKIKISIVWHQRARKRKKCFKFFALACAHQIYFVHLSLLSFSKVGWKCKGEENLSRNFSTNVSLPWCSLKNINLLTTTTMMMLYRKELPHNIDWMQWKINKSNSKTTEQ